MNRQFTSLVTVEEALTDTIRVPYHLFLAMDERPDFICISEGMGHASAGGSLTPAEFISGRYDAHIARFEAGWLRALIEKTGPESITAQDVLEDWKRRGVPEGQRKRASADR